MLLNQNNNIIAHGNNIYESKQGKYIFLKNINIFNETSGSISTAITSIQIVGEYIYMLRKGSVYKYTLSTLEFIESFSPTLSRLAGYAMFIDDDKIYIVYTQENRNIYLNSYNLADYTFISSTTIGKDAGTINIAADKDNGIVYIIAGIADKPSYVYKVDFINMKVLQGSIGYNNTSYNQYTAQFIAYDSISKLIYFGNYTSPEVVVLDSNLSKVRSIVVKFSSESSSAFYDIITSSILIYKSNLGTTVSSYTISTKTNLQISAVAPFFSNYTTNGAWLCNNIDATTIDGTRYLYQSHPLGIAILKLN